MELRLIFISQTTPSTELNYLTTCGWPDSAQIKNLVGQNKTISRNKVANTTSSKFWDSLASVTAMSVLRTRCRTCLAFIPFVVQTVICTFTVGFTVVLTPKLTYCGFSGDLLLLLLCLMYIHCSIHAAHVSVFAVCQVWRWQVWGRRAGSSVTLGQDTVTSDRSINSNTPTPTLPPTFYTRAWKLMLPKFYTHGEGLLLVESAY